MRDSIIHLASVVATQVATADSTEIALGKLYAIEYRAGTMDTNADLTVTAGGKTLLVKANAGTSNVWFYPRDIMQAVANGADLTATNGGDCTQPIICGRITATIAQAGATTIRTAIVIVYWEAK